MRKYGLFIYKNILMWGEYYFPLMISAIHIKKYPNNIALKNFLIMISLYISKFFYNVYSHLTPPLSQRGCLYIQISYNKTCIF